VSNYGIPINCARTYLTTLSGRALPTFHASLPELFPLWNVSGAPVVGEEACVSELLTAFFGWDPEANFLEFIAWAGYLLAVGFAFLRPQPLPEGVSQPATTRNS
jgi:hypothetical protein